MEIRKKNYLGPKLIFALAVWVTIFMLTHIVSSAEEMLTDPILQNPGDDSVIIEWFTDFEGQNHKILLYENGSAGMPTRVIKAETTLMSRVRGGDKESTCNDPKLNSGIYKHIATVTGLPKNMGRKQDKVIYKVVSDGKASGMYSLQAKAAPGTPMRILLTSDLQLKSMCAANIEKVYETVGQVDAVWANGDIVDVADRAYDWFYADNSFYKVMQGRAESKIGGKVYKGAAILQNAPMYTAIGNHDVMGVYSETEDLSVQFNSPATREYAKKKLVSSYNIENMSEEEKEQFILDNSYNTITYEEMFELPESVTGKEKYYSVQMGDVYMIVLDVSRVWKLPNLGMIGKYSEWPGADESRYGFGDFIFEPIDANSEQIAFLKKELQSTEYRNAKYKVVMFHNEAHSLGNNQIPPFTDPVGTIVKDPVTGLNMMTYDYPIEKDYIATVIEPLLINNGTNLLFNAHSHLWNRFETKNGMSILQTSNVGNSYGAFLDNSTLNGTDLTGGSEWGKRTDYPSALNPGDNYYSIRNNWKASNYIREGDPYGLLPIAPNIADLPGSVPYLASNTITSFSVFDTGTGKISSYYFDTEKPDSKVVLFDEYSLK